MRFWVVWLLDQVENIRRERALLDVLDNPGVIKLYFTFQDAASLYMGLQLCENGEALPLLRISLFLAWGSMLGGLPFLA